MAPRFRRVDRDQQFLLPPDVREWLPAGHPAMFVVSLVEQLDLSVFVSRYRGSEDQGRPAFHPEVMVGIALYASMTSVMSSRRIEKLLAVDVAFRVVAANERPDHSTICRFLIRHRDDLKVLFARVVGLAAEAGLVDPTLVAVDGTKIAGDASRSQNVTLEDLRERFAEWARTVERNDQADEAAEQAGQGSDPIVEMLNDDTMREWIRRRLDEREGDPGDRRMNLTDPDSALMPRSGGGWVQGYNAQAAAVEGGIVIAAEVTSNPNDSTMLEPMVREIGDAIKAATGEDVGVVVADAGYWDSTTVERIETDPELADLLVATRRWLPDQAPAPLPQRDPAAFDSELAAQHARRSEVVARVVNGELRLREAGDLLGLSDKRVSALKQQWTQAGGPDGIRPERLRTRRRPQPTPSITRVRHEMTTRLARPAGRSLYRQRQAIIEPVFGDVKANRRITRFLRRGHERVLAEWRWILIGHNLTILHRHSTT